MVANVTHGQQKSFLAALGLTLPVTVRDVKQAYFEKAKTAHPDVGGSDESFKQLQTAYERGTDYAHCHGIDWIRSAVDRYVAQQCVIDEVTRLGGWVTVEGIDWIEHEVGEDFAHLFERVVSIRLRGPQIGDGFLEYLMRKRDVLAELRILDLAESRITDKGLECLRSFKNLRQLDLRGTRFTNRRVELLLQLPKLEWLAIQRTRVPSWGYFKLWWYFPKLKIVSSRQELRRIECRCKALSREKR